MRQKRQLLKEAKDEPSPRSEIVGSVAAHRRQTCHNARIYWRNHRKILIPFSSTLKSIQGRFGTGLGSYFIFLRWLLGLNFLLGLILVVFVVAPVVVSRRAVMSDGDSVCPPGQNGSVQCCSKEYADFTTSEGDLFDDVASFVSGNGWMEMTHLFYGFYPNTRLTFHASPVVYHFPLAYMLACTACFLLSFVLIVYESAKRFRESLVSEKGNFHVYCNVVFASWDFCIKDQKAAAVEHNVITNELKMMLQSESSQLFCWFSFLSRVQCFQSIHYCVRFGVIMGF
jgi:hypothetical protein